MLLRMTSRGSTAIRCGGRPDSSIRRTAAATACWPSATVSRLAVVRSTADRRANRVSSYPVTDSWPGIAMPARGQHPHRADGLLVVPGDQRGRQHLGGQQPPGGFTARLLGVARIAYLDHLTKPPGSRGGLGEATKPFGGAGQAGTVHVGQVPVPETGQMLHRLGDAALAVGVDNVVSGVAAAGADHHHGHPGPAGQRLQPGVGQLQTERQDGSAAVAEEFLDGPRLNGPDDPSTG